MVPTYAQVRDLVYAAIKVHPDNVEKGSNALILLGALYSLDDGDAFEAREVAREAVSRTVGTDDELKYKAAYASFLDYIEAYGGDEW